MSISRHSSGDAFSLIEIMVVVVIIGLLAALAIPAFQRVRSASQDKSVLNNARQMAAAADSYFLETGTNFAASTSLIGPANYVKVFDPVANETYPLNYTQGVTVTVTGVGAARTFAWRNLGGGGTQTGTIDLQGMRLVLGLVGNFVLGALMTLGIGLYAPCMILVGLLGMNASAAFPIMMGSCAFLMPMASVRFAQKGAYTFKPALGLALGGIPGVLIAAFIVKSMDITTVRWLVVGVVLIAATMMLRSAAKGE